MNKSCLICKHLRGEKRGKLVCAAFPGGIPFQIVSGEIMHDKVIGEEAQTWELGDLGNDEEGGA